MRPKSNNVAMFLQGFLQDASLCRLRLTRHWKMRLKGTVAWVLREFLQEAPWLASLR